MKKRNNTNKPFDIDDVMNKPCTLTEVVQVARGVAEDVVTDYQRTTQPVQVAMSLQMEIIKSIIIEAGLITEEKFKELYVEEAEKFNQMQKEKFNMQSKEEEEEETPTGRPDMRVVSNDIEVETES